MEKVDCETEPKPSKPQVDLSGNHFVVHNTFLELQDSPSLKEWCGSMRRVKSCPDLHGLHPAAESEQSPPPPVPPTPEVSPCAKRRYSLRSSPTSQAAEVPGRAGDELQPNASRTRLSSQASPYRPPPNPCAHSTTYYAVPAVQRAVVQHQVLPRSTQSAPKTTVPVPPVILGSAALPSIGSGGHATGECKPCVFFHKKGCATGRTCLFCHLCQPGERQRRKHEKSLTCREGRFGRGPMSKRNVVQSSLGI